jgi:hypothetical protein
MISKMLMTVEDWRYDYCPLFEKAGFNYKYLRKMKYIATLFSGF